MFCIRAGNCRLIGYRKRLWASIGPHWWCAVLTLAAICVSWCLVLNRLSTFSPTWQALTMVIQTTMTLAYLHGAIVDPGTVLRDQVPDGPTCDVCKFRHRISTDHCEDCQVCIRCYDHHCIFFGKCIGRNNLRSFHIFLASMLLQIILLLAATVLSIKRPKA